MMLHWQFNLYRLPITSSEWHNSKSICSQSSVFVRRNALWKLENPTFSKQINTKLSQHLESIYLIISVKLLFLFNIRFK